MVLLKKFLIALAIALYSVAPVFAGDSDRVRGHWQWQGLKMLDLTVDQQTVWTQLKLAHLEDMQASVQDFRLTKKRLRIAFQSSAGKEGLISHYKREYQIAVGQSLTPYQRLQGSGKSWGQGHGKNSNKRHGMGWDKGAGKRGDRSRGDKSQKNRKKKSFDSD